MFRSSWSTHIPLWSSNLRGLFHHRSHWPIGKHHEITIGLLQSDIHTYWYQYINIKIKTKININKYIYIYTRKPCVSPSPKSSSVPFDVCFSCKRNAFFPIFKLKNVHFNLWPPMNLSTSILRGRRGVSWPCKNCSLHFRWQACGVSRFLTF